MGYQVAASEEKQINAYGGGPRLEYGGGVATATTSTLMIGSVNLDTYETSTKLVVLRGVAKLLQNYPPKKK
jgi:hypothetical protein